MVADLKVNSELWLIYMLVFLCFDLGRMDPEGAFRLCIQVSSFVAKLDDGSVVDVQRRCDEWIVDYRWYTMEKLEVDLAKRIQWGSSQQPRIAEYSLSSSGERELVDDVSLSFAFSERLSDRKLFIYVDVVEKAIESVCNSTLTGGALNHVLVENPCTQVDSCNNAVGSEVIDWDTLLTSPIGEHQIGAAVPIMDEDAVYAFVGLREQRMREQKKKGALLLIMMRLHLVMVIH